MQWKIKSLHCSPLIHLRWIEWRLAERWALAPKAFAFKNDFFFKLSFVGPAPTSLSWWLIKLEAREKAHDPVSLSLCDQKKKMLPRVNMKNLSIFISFHISSPNLNHPVSKFPPSSLPPPSLFSTSLPPTLPGYTPGGLQSLATFAWGGLCHWRLRCCEHTGECVCVPVLTRDIRKLYKSHRSNLK